MNPRLRVCLISTFILLWIMLLIIQINAFDGVYPISYPGICKQRLRINTLCNELEQHVTNKANTKSSDSHPPNISNDISKKLLDIQNAYIDHDYEHHHHHINNHPDGNENIEHTMLSHDDIEHPDNVDTDDDYNKRNYISQFTYGLFIFTIISLYCIYMSEKSEKKERKHDGKILPLYN